VKKEGPANHDARRNKRKRRPLQGHEMTVAKHSQQQHERRQPRNEHFEQLLEKLCTNHGFPVKHKFKDCDLMKRLLRLAGRNGNDGRDKRPPVDQEKEKFPVVDRCLVIIGGLEDDCSKR
jgi:hypothetical protein